MPRQANVSTEYTFANGLITQATGLNFPENACTETWNCVFEETGPVRRREQFDFEDSYRLNEVDHTNKAITTYNWYGVTTLGIFSIVVKQVGTTLYFYDTTNTDSLSDGIYIGAELDLTAFSSGVLNPNSCL